MSERPIIEQLSRHGIIPVVAIDDAASALPLADALLDAGLPVIEVTFRTRAAAQVLQTLRRERPQLLAGAGTVITEANVDEARACGASFAVAPGVNRAIVQYAQKAGLPFIPGIATPTELETALALGMHLLKFFPAEALGGATMLEAIAAPYRHAGVRFMPTGGVSLANMESYLKLDIVAAVGGTWLARKEDIAAGNWDEIRSRCRIARERAEAIRRKE